MNTQPKWLADIAYNFERGDTLEVWHEGKRFAIVRFPAHRYWSDRMNPNQYAPVSYFLHDKKSERPATALFTHEVHSGRLKKADMERMKRMVELSEEAGEKVLLSSGGNQ